MTRIKKITLAMAVATGLSFSALSQAQAPGLVKVYDMAVIHDAKLAQAQANFRSENEIIHQAKSLLRPSVNATASVSMADIEQEDIRQSIGLELNQAVFNKEAFVRYDQATYRLQAAEVTLKLAEQDLMLRVATAYFDVLLAEQKVELAKSKQDADKIQWEKAEASAQVGLASRTDVLQARSAYDLSISSLINAENELDISIEELTKLTGQNLTQLRRLMLDVQIAPVVLKKPELEKQAELNNLRVALAQLQRQVTNQEVLSQKSTELPRVNFQASSRYLNCNGSDVAFCQDGLTHSVNLTASMPLYTGGLTDSRIAQARFDTEAADSALRDAREQARLDARVQARNLERSHALVLALREAVKSSEAFLEAAEEGYRVGLRNMIDVVSARASLFDEQSNLAAALHGLLITQLRLETALGQLDVEDLRQLDQLLAG
jgi:outer membrane protein